MNVIPSLNDSSFANNFLQNISVIKCITFSQHHIMHCCCALIRHGYLSTQKHAVVVSTKLINSVMRAAIRTADMGEWITAITYILHTYYSYIRTLLDEFKIVYATECSSFNSIYHIYISYIQNK